MVKDIILGIILGVMVGFALCTICWVFDESGSEEKLTKHYFRLMVPVLLCSMALGSGVGYRKYTYDKLYNDIYIETVDMIETQASEDILGYYNIDNKVLNEYYLDSCPVCHSNDFIITYDEFGDTNDWNIECKGCHTSVVSEDGTLDEVIKRWNSLNKEQRCPNRHMIFKPLKERG